MSSQEIHNPTPVLASDEAAPDADTRLWNDLALRLETFLGAWAQTGESANPPPIADHLPAEPPVLRRLVLVELIKADLEQRASRTSGEGSVNELPTLLRGGSDTSGIVIKRLEKYVESFPELVEAATGEPSVDLIYEEYHVRRSAGEKVSLKEYAQRFPNSREPLEKLLGAQGISASSALFPARRIEGFQVGEKLDDFELLHALGQGAFASVFLARQISMQRLVALKISAEKGNEPQTLAQLDHPNIVRVYDQRRLPERRARLLYMQYAAGGTLAEVITCVRRTPAGMRSGAQLIVAVDAAMAKAAQVVSEDASWRRRMAALPWPETVCRLGIQVAQALDYAHSHGVLHRDVKPANILLSAEGSPKLADFNISFGSHVAGATPAAYFGGSLAYMSPEQLEACSPVHACKPEDLDGRADLYSMAVVLWELLHGERPFSEEALEEGWNETLEAMIRQRRAAKFRTPLVPTLGRDQVSRRLDLVLRKALSPDPTARYQFGVELARDLTLCLHGRSWELFHDFGSSWRGMTRRQPLAAIIPVNLIPNLFAGLYNLWFNYVTFIRDEGAEFERAFWIVTFFINSTAFPLGVILGSLYAWPVVKMVWRIARGLPCTPEELAAARLRSLRLGQVIALIGVTEWLIAGVVFPLCIRLMAGHFPTHGYFHFFLSLAACGLIAAAFPYLGTTWLAVRVFYPALLASSTPDMREQRALAAIPQQAGVYLAIAAVVPMLATLLVIFAAPANKLEASLLIVAGLIGFVAAWLAYGRIRGDVGALNVATRTTDTFGMGTETSDGF